MSDPEFRPFQKIARYSRECIITEKIDGTNGVIYIPEVGDMVDGIESVRAGSKSRWLTTEKSGDNFGFCRWVTEHQEELAALLGPGYHYGEWWGKGIQRGYGLEEKRFTLFNPFRYERLPLGGLVSTVPVLYVGPFHTREIVHTLHLLELSGSIVAPGFSKPEGIVIYHTASKTLLKKTIEGDASPKGQNDA